MATANTTIPAVQSITPPAEQKPEMRLFKSSILSCKYIFCNGVTANFVNGKYATADEGQIAEFETQIRQGHPHIYVDKNQITIDYDHTNPLAELRKRFFQEFLDAQAEQKVAAANRDLGVAVHGALKGTNTTDIAPVTIGNTSAKG